MPLKGTPIFQQRLRTANSSDTSNFWDPTRGIFRADYDLLDFGPLVEQVGTLSISSNNLFADGNNLVSGVMIGEFSVDVAKVQASLPLVSLMIPGPQFTVTFVVEGSRILPQGQGESPNTYIGNTLFLLGFEPTTSSSTCFGTIGYLTADQSLAGQCDMCETGCMPNSCPNLDCATGDSMSLPSFDFVEQFRAIAVDSSTDMIQVLPNGPSATMIPAFENNIPVEFMLRWTNDEITWRVGMEMIFVAQVTPETNSIRIRLLPGARLGHRILLVNPQLNGNILAPLTAGTGEDAILQVRGREISSSPSVITGYLIFQVPTFNPVSNLVEISVGSETLNCLDCPNQLCDNCDFSDHAPCKGGQFKILDTCDTQGLSYALRLNGLDGQLYNGFPTIWIFSAERGGANLTMYSEGCDAQFRYDFKIRISGTVFGGFRRDANTIEDEQLYQIDFTYDSAQYQNGVVVAEFDHPNGGFLKNLSNGTVYELFQSNHDQAQFQIEEPAVSGCPNWGATGWLSHSGLIERTTGNPVVTGGEAWNFQISQCERTCRCLPPPNLQCWESNVTSLQPCNPLGCWRPRTGTPGCENPYFPS